MSPKLAVVTVTYSPGEHLENFLSTLAVATTEKPQVIMADNGSTDGAPEAADAKYEHCLLYTSPSPRDRQKSRMPSSA